MSYYNEISRLGRRSSFRFQLDHGLGRGLLRPREWTNDSDMDKVYNFTPDKT